MTATRPRDVHDIQHSQLPATIPFEGNDFLSAADDLEPTAEQVGREIQLRNQRGAVQQTSQTITWRGFRIPATDHHGHSERMWVSVQPGHDRIVGAIVAAKVFPYRTKGDVVRHAIDRHIKWLEMQQPLGSVTAQVDAIMELLLEDEFQTDFRTMFEKLQTQVSVYVGLGATLEARGLVARVKAFIDMMPAEDPWKGRYEQELVDRFSHLIDNARGVTLRDMMKDGKEE